MRSCGRWVAVRWVAPSVAVQSDPMDHDRLFKQLLMTFFFEFVVLFLPEVDAYLSRDTIEFLVKEIFTDLTGGERHEVDVIAKVKFRDADTFFLFHAEPQGRSRGRFPRRMFHYVARLDEKYDLPIYPVAIFTFDAPQRAEENRYQIVFPDRTVLDFSFRAIQLNRLDWKDFADKDNPVASALMAKMRTEPQDRPKVKLACMRMMLRLPLNDAQRALIREFVDFYLRLDAPERVIYEQEAAKLEPPEKEKVMAVINEWTEAALEQGREQVFVPLLSALGRIFGELPPELEEQVRRLSASQLKELGSEMVAIASLQDLQIWLDSRTA
jgi:hypothetical protein